MRVLFVHPDLGVGGAERLIVDTALAAKSSGHEVTILTNHYDPRHCFEDTKDLDIIVKLSCLPRQIGGRFHAFFAYLKMFLAAVWLVYFSGLKYDVVICDQISLPVAVFKFNKIKVLFYCHFPDQLLCVYDKRRNFLKRIYRAPIDWLEVTTTGMADVVLVNSQFTSKIFRQTFTRLANKQIDVLYPSLNTEIFDALLEQFSSSSADLASTAEKEARDPALGRENAKELGKLRNKKFVFLSINRYERKKDLGLAIKAMAKVRERLGEKSETWKACQLVMAGGYDYRVKENVEYYQELRDLASESQVDASITFLRSVSDSQKVNLLRRAFCLIYTPTNEHFGIVPVEAMYCEKPVIATNTGGPLETVANGVTGYLVDPNADEFADKMAHLVQNPAEQQKMSLAARNRVIQKFSFIAFKHQLNGILEGMIKRESNGKQKSQ